MGRLLRIYSQSFKGLSLEAWMLSIVMLINRTGSMVLPFLGIYMIDHLKFSIEQSGIVLACFGIGSLIGSWLGGFLTDKFSEYRVQLSSLFISVPLFCLYPLFTTPISLGIIVLIQSVVSEIFRPANSVAITKYAKPENLTRAFSLNRMAINLGFSIGPAIAGILSSISYNFLFFANALTALIAGLVYLNFFKRRHTIFEYRKKKINSLELKTPTLVIKKSAYSDGPFWIFCLLCLMFSIAFFQLLNTLPLFYKKELLLSQSVIGYLMALNGIVVVIFEMLLVHIAEKKFSLAQTMFLGTVLCGISFLCLGFHPGYILLSLSMILLSLGEILVLPFMSTITALRASEYNKGAYMGFNGMSISLAFIISPLLGTKLAGLFGFGNLWIGTALLLILTSVAFYYYIPFLISKSRK